MMADDFSALIPELPKWNDGAGIEAQAWIECVAGDRLQPHLLAALRSI